MLIGEMVPKNIALAAPVKTALLLGPPPVALTRALRPVIFSAPHAVTRVRIDTPLDDTLTALRAASSHLAAVTGGKGAVLGFVTVEDVPEELVGPAA